MLQQKLFGYDAFHAGLVLSAPVFFTMGILAIAGFLMGKKVDARFIIPLGLLCLAGGSYRQVHVDLYAWPSTLIAPRCIQTTGVGMLFVPPNNAAYLHVPAGPINKATGLFNMLRYVGGSLGVVIVDVLVDRRGQFSAHFADEEDGGQRRARDSLMHNASYTGSQYLTRVL